MKKNNILEKDVESLLIEACDKMGFEHFKGESSNNKGFVDRVVFNNISKKILYIEIKNETYYQQTKLQKRWERIIRECNGEFHLVNGKEEMIKFIKEYITGGE